MVQRGEWAARFHRRGVKSRRLSFEWLSDCDSCQLLMMSRWWQFEFMMAWWVLLWRVGLHAVEKAFWWCRGERGKSGTIFIWFKLYFLNFQYCSTKQQQTLLYCINHFNTNKKLSCCREAAQCFQFVCSQLQHTAQFFITSYCGFRFTSA